MIVQNGHSLPPGETVDGRETRTDSLKSHAFTVAFPCWQLGAETGVQSSDLQWMRNIIRVMPLVVLPITIHFPTVGNEFGASSTASTSPRHPLVAWPLMQLLSTLSLLSPRQCLCTGSPPICFPWSKCPACGFQLYALSSKSLRVLSMTLTNYLHGKASSQASKKVKVHTSRRQWSESGDGTDCSSSHRLEEC